MLGPLVRLPEAENGEPIVSGYDLWRFVERSEDAAELNRLLYVATTRAADYLILSSSVSELGSASGPWLQLLARRFDLFDGRFLGKLPAGAAMPEVLVTSEESPPASRVSKPSRRRRSHDRGSAAQHSRQRQRRAAESRQSSPANGRGGSIPFHGCTAQCIFRLRVSTTASGSPSEASDPRSLGTLVHAVLAALDLRQPGSCHELVKRYARRHLGEDPSQVAEAGK